MCGSRESLVLKTTLWKEDIVLEPNMFPCKHCFLFTLFLFCHNSVLVSLNSIFAVRVITVNFLFSLSIFLSTFSVDYTPYGVEHYTLWSVEDLTHEQVLMSEILMFCVYFNRRT